MNEILATVDLYENDGYYRASIGLENASEYECSGTTKEQCLQEVMDYLRDIWD